MAVGLGEVYQLYSSPHSFLKQSKDVLKAEEHVDTHERSMAATPDCATQLLIWSQTYKI